MDLLIKEMILYFKEDVRRINHALKVSGLVNAIAAAEAVSEREAYIAGLAGVFHDIGIKEAERKHQSAAGKYQELEGPPIAAEILAANGIPAEIADRVCFLVGNHHSYGKIDGVDFQILIEADFLVNIFEDTMDRAAIEKIKEKYFKTTTGIRLMESMYLP